MYLIFLFESLVIALDDRNNFQSEQGVSQNRNIHNVAIKYFMKATENSRAKAKASRRTMQILQECRSLFFKQWVFLIETTRWILSPSTRTTMKMINSILMIMKCFKCVSPVLLVWCCFAILSVANYYIITISCSSCFNGICELL